MLGAQVRLLPGRLLCGSAVIQLCERVYFGLLGRLEPRVLPRTEALTEGEDAASPSWREPARRIEDWLESPDRTQDLRSWLVAFVRDLLEVDAVAVAVYSRRTRSGGLYTLELVDGATIKPLLDDDGRTPRLPHPAYQQFLYGMPAPTAAAASRRRVASRHEISRIRRPR